VAVVNSVAPEKPLLRGWMHLVWFEACLVLGTLALVHTHGAVRITGLAIFVVSVSAMFGVSAFYHRGNWSETWRVRLQRVDHAMIFLLIAGTATPAFLIASQGVFRVACLAALWGLTLAAGTIHMVWMNAPELLVGSTFVALGWAGGLALPAVWLNSGAAAGILLLVGGLLYTAGTLFYAWERLRYGHAIWHVFVLGGSICHYIAVFRYAVPSL